MEIHYLDNAATTPVLPEAVQAAAEAMSRGWGNPSSGHSLGRQAAEQLKAWREEISRAMGCAARELYFTSGGSEGDNWAILSAARAGRHRGRHIITSALEHDAVLQPCRALEAQGYTVTCLEPDAKGNISPEALAMALREDTVLVSLMLVNNELGTVTDIREMVRLVRESGCGAIFHCDAVQGFLKLPTPVCQLGADLVTVSGHKIHAPKGVGALYLRSGLKLEALIRGGGQEGGLRAGTEATGQIAAFAAAARIGARNLAQNLERMARLKAEAAQLLRARVPELVFLGEGSAAHILPISLPGYPGEVLVRFLSDRGVYVSSGSACHRGKPSRVYGALPLSPAVKRGALRVSFSEQTERADVAALAEGLAAARDVLLPAG